MLIISSFRTNQIWRFVHNYFGYDPLHGDYNVAGLVYQWRAGIFSLTLSNRNDVGFKTAYFHAMSSIAEFSVSTEILKNSTLAARHHHGNDFKVNFKRKELIITHY